MIAVRWWLVIPAAAAAWYATFILGALAYSVMENHLCPPQDLISGVCTNRFIRVALEMTMHVFVALSAISVISAAVSVAPSRKQTVAWSAFIFGAAIAFYFGARTDHYALCAAALLGGAGTLLYIHLRRRVVRRDLTQLQRGHS